MGNEMSQEAKVVIKKVIDLRRDHTNWKSVIEEFNTVLPADFSVKKFEDKRIVDLVLQLLATQLKGNPTDERGITDLLEASRRLLRFKGLYKNISKCNITPWLQALQNDKPEIVEAALNVMRNLVEYTGLETKEDMKITIESQARDQLFQSRGFQFLVETLQRYASSSQQLWVLVAGILRIFTLVLLTAPRSTPVDAVEPIVSSLHPMIPQLLEMSYDVNPDICYFGIMIVQALILHSDTKMTKKIQSLALSSGCLLRHFYISVSGESSLQARHRVGANAKAILLESRNLIGLLTDGHTKSTDTIQRCLPNHLLKRLWENHPFPKNFVFAKVRSGITTLDATWQRYQKGSHRANWIAFFLDLDQEHNLPHLIWNETTRTELLETLNNEVLELEHQKKRNPAAEWDYEGFEPRYPSVEAELQVHGYYLKQLLSTLNDSKSTYEINQKELLTLINHLYNHAVIEDKPIWKWACLRTMSALYRRYSQVLLDFEPLGYLVWLMSPKHTRPLWRDHILEFLRDLLQHQPNARRFMQADGVRHLVTYMSQAHTGPNKFLHGRQMSLEPIYAIPIQSAILVAPIEAVAEEGDESEDFGPIPQPINNGQLATVCIDLLKLLLNRVPRLCKSITKMAEFQHILQFLLAPDVAQANRILPIITQLSLSSVWAQSTLWQRGVFLFTFCAMGERCDPAAIQLLQAFHMKQAEEFGTSVLSPFLPLPMIRYLQLHPPEKFCEMFDGDVNQPDLIWNRSLRDRLISSARNDVAHFQNQLQERPMTLYTFSKPNTVVYPELINEVCCGGIYLQNFVRDAAFEIVDPVFMMNGFVDAMKIGLSDTDLDYLLQCQVIAVGRFPDLLQCSQFPVFAELLKILTRDLHEELDLLLVDRAAELMYHLLTVPNSENLPNCLQEDGFVSTSQALLNTVQFDVTDPTTKHLLQKLIRILNILAFANEDAIVTMHQNPQVIIELASLIVEDFAMAHQGVTIEAVRLFRILAESHITCRDFLTSGALLSVLNICFFFTEGSDLVIEATNALASFAKQADAPELADADIKTILRQLLTPGLYARLSKPDRFMKDARGTFWTPCLIWGDTQREELHKYLRAQVDLVQQSHLWDGSTAAHLLQYTAVSTEITICDVFLQLYNEQPEYSIPNDSREFVTGLIQHLHSVTLSLTGKKATEHPAIFGDITTTAHSIARLLHDVPSLSRSSSQDELVSAINDLFNTLDRNILHGSLLIVDVLCRKDSSFNITIQYAFIIHRLLNYDRQSLTDLPSMKLSLDILNILCRKDPEIVDAFFDDGLLVSLTNIFTDIRKGASECRLLAAEIFGVLAADSRKGEAYTDMLAHIFAPTFKELFLQSSTNQQSLIEFYDDNHDTPIVFWTEHCRTDLIAFIKQEMQDLLAHQQQALQEGVGSAPYQWNWAGIHERFNQKTLGAEIYIDSIYINAFNANPYFQVKPDRFFLKLVEALYGVYSEYETFRNEGQTEWIQTSVKNLLALWEAALNLLTNLPHLQDLCVEYLDYIFGYFHPSVDSALQTTVLKVACILATNTHCAESIAKFRLVKNIMPLLETLRTRNCIIQILNFLLDCIRRSSPAVSQIRSTGGLIMILNIILGSDYNQEERECAAMIASAMVQDNVYGASIASFIQLVFTEKFKTIFQSRPSKFVDFVDSEHISSADDRLWNAENRSALTKLLKSESAALATEMWFWDGTSDLWDTSLLSSIWADVSKKEIAPVPVPVVQQPEPVVDEAIVDLNALKAIEDLSAMESLRDEFF